MDTNYKVIQTIKKSDKAEVSFGTMDDFDKPVIIKHLYDTNAEVYRVIGNLKTDYFPKIYAMEERENELLVIEEYIDGQTLDKYFESDALNTVEVLEKLVQLCEALDELHSCEPPVIHRDIKPSNILVDKDGRIKIIDFDASRQYKGQKNTSDTRLLGTIEYAAPEQFGYAQTDSRSDIYSVGVVFSELHLFEKTLLKKKWERIVGKCTSFDPKHRYKDIRLVKKDLQKCIYRAKYPLLVPVLMMLMLVAVTVGTWMGGKEAPTSEPTSTGEVLAPENKLTWAFPKMSSYSCILRPDEICVITKVYICEQADPEDPYSEILVEAENGLFELCEEGRGIRLGKQFWNTYVKGNILTLYVEFDDGYGEKIWINCEKTSLE